MQVHDELVLEVPQEELEAVAPLVREVMESAYVMDVPLQVDIEAGKKLARYGGTAKFLVRRIKFLGERPLKTKN